jgi:hypothetical protein
LRSSIDEVYSSSIFSAVEQGLMMRSGASTFETKKTKVFAIKFDARLATNPFPSQNVEMIHSEKQALIRCHIPPSDGQQGDEKKNEPPRYGLRWQDEGETFSNFQEVVNRYEDAESKKKLAEMEEIFFGAYEAWWEIFLPRDKFSWKTDVVFAGHVFPRFILSDFKFGSRPIALTITLTVSDFAKERIDFLPTMAVEGPPNIINLVKDEIYDRCPHLKPSRKPAPTKGTVSCSNGRVAPEESPVDNAIDEYGLAASDYGQTPAEQMPEVSSHVSLYSFTKIFQEAWENSSWKSIVGWGALILVTFPFDSVLAGGILLTFVMDICWLPVALYYEKETMYVTRSYLKILRSLVEFSFCVLDGRSVDAAKTQDLVGVGDASVKDVDSKDQKLDAGKAAAELSKPPSPQPADGHDSDSDVEQPAYVLDARSDDTEKKQDLAGVGDASVKGVDSNQLSHDSPHPANVPSPQLADGQDSDSDAEQQSAAPVPLLLDSTATQGQGVEATPPTTPEAPPAAATSSAETSVRVGPMTLTPAPRCAPAAAAPAVFSALSPNA